MRPDFCLPVVLSSLHCPVSTAQHSGISDSSYSWEWREGTIRLPKPTAPREELQNLHTPARMATEDFSSKENVLQRLVKATICIVILGLLTS